MACKTMDGEDADFMLSHTGTRVQTVLALDSDEDDDEDDDDGG
jgi:hypothetical protein